VSAAANASRTQVWLEGLGDWAWPGTAAAADSLLPPAWVPTVPPGREPALGTDTGAPPLRRRLTPRRLLLAGLLSALAAVSLALAAKGPLAPTLGLEGAAHAPVAEEATLLGPVSATAALPPLVRGTRDAAGSEIAHASFASQALAEEGSFLVYLPPGYRASAYHYPVLYLLHGQEGHADEFLQVGLQKTLDSLIARGAVPPMIAVMVQDANWLDNWHNVGWRNSASYVVEVQQLVDRMLPTIAARSARAIAGSSKGGFGAMNVALSNPYRFSVVESWLGYFNGLEGKLSRDRPVIGQLGLHAYVYGAQGDTAAEPSEDPAFGEALRAAGAQAQGAVVPGNHSLTTVSEHLEEMLLFAGDSLREAAVRQGIEADAPRPAATPGAALVAERAGA
jgi:S-formylglutathione hydrolase FrmB